MKAPFAATGTVVPLMASVASPEPIAPRTKFESRLVMTWLAAGYCTRSASGAPRTGVTGGSDRRAASGDAPGAEVGPVRGAGGAHAASPSSSAVADTIACGHRPRQR